MSTPLCLSIAGSDSGGEAGIQADLKTFSDFECHGLSTITANTAQNPTTIISLNPVNIECFQDQIKALFDYFDIQFIKTGLLPNPEIMKAILERIPEDAILVSDPLIASTSGTQIMNSRTLNFFKKEFCSRIDFLTPNFLEAEILLNAKKPLNKTAQLSQFARKGIFLKGGHSDSPGVDYFFDGQKQWKLTAPKLKIRSSHGTGCRISSALCAGLALGKSAIESATMSKNYVFHTLKSCKKTAQNQWLMCSPGNIFSLENSVNVEKI